MCDIVAEKLRFLTGFSFQHAQIHFLTSGLGLSLMRLRAGSCQFRGIVSTEVVKQV